MVKWRPQAKKSKQPKTALSFSGKFSMPHCPQIGLYFPQTWLLPVTDRKISLTGNDKINAEYADMRTDAHWKKCHMAKASVDGVAAKKLPE